MQNIRHATYNLLNIQYNLFNIHNELLPIACNFVMAAMPCLAAKKYTCFVGVVEVFGYWLRAHASDQRMLSV